MVQSRWNAPLDAVEQADLVAQRHHQPAAVGQPEGADLAGEGPLFRRAACQIDAVDRPVDDVLEEERVLAVVIDRALAEIAADGFVERLEIEHGQCLPNEEWRATPSRRRRPMGRPPPGGGGQ